MYNKVNFVVSRLKLTPQKIKNFLLTASYEQKYLATAAMILLSTTIFWSLLSSGVQLHNSDQLADPYLFHNSATLHGASFPGQHTFLIKWPLFWLVSLFGYSAWSFSLLTIASVIATIGALAYILSRIERRPMVLGTYLLALSAILLLVPAEPYAGAILPLNMAMLATRNIEYIAYIGALYGLVKYASLRTRGFWLSVVLLILLGASDKLFLSISLVGAGLALISYALASSWTLVSLSARWLVATAVAVIGADSVLWLIAKAHIAKVANSFGSGPYGIIHSVHNLVLGSIYGVLGLFTNFGANPAYDSTIVKRIPAQSVSRLFGWQGPAEVINFTLVIVGLYLVWRLVRASFEPNIHRKKRLWDNYAKLAVVLGWSSVAAMGVFILSDHYWAVDARYLTIFVFALFIGASVTTRKHKWSRQTLNRFAILLILVMAIALPGVFHSYALENNAQSDIVNRNEDVAQILRHHKVDVLVGDYWRVLPIKQSNANLAVMPLDNCSSARDVLASSQWHYDLQKHSFAYLLTLNGSLTNFPNCTIDSVVKAYGRPNTSVVIAGSQSSPSELLLFYDKGSKKSSPLINPSALSTVLPIPLSELPYTNCPNGTTIMNVVAHQDDDLLFMNPDTQTALDNGHCIRTVYVTAGDAGSDRFYWLGREQGSEAAYSSMLKSQSVWINRVVKIAPNEYIQVSHPRNDYRASLIFMHLPDGNLNGGGFRQRLYESLERLQAGRIDTIESVDNQSTYNLNQLTSALSDLMRVYQPVEVRTQANFSSKQYPDHSDHMTVGKIVQKSLADYLSKQFENSVQIPIKYYIGYPIRSMPANLSPAEQQQKMIIFFTYGKFDGAVCTSSADCSKGPYGFYLERQYSN